MQSCTTAGQVRSSKLPAATAAACARPVHPALPLPHAASSRLALPAGIPDYSTEWFAVYNVSSTLQATRAELTRLALARLDHGFSPLDAASLEGGSRLRDAYDAYFLDFIRTVQASLL